jgi:hypothetical protein
LVREIRDDEGRPWRITLNVSALMRIRDSVTYEAEVENEDGTKTKQTGPLDLADIGSIDKTLTVLKLQYTKLGEILWAILEPQATEKNISRDSFLDGLRGDALEEAAKAMEAELIDFFPKRHRQMVQLMAEKYDELTVAMVEHAEQQMAAVNVDGALSGMPSGRQPESSDATQANGRSANSAKRATRGLKRTGGTLQTSSH